MEAGNQFHSLLPPDQQLFYNLLDIDFTTTPTRPAFHRHSHE